MMHLAEKKKRTILIVFYECDELKLFKRRFMESRAHDAFVASLRDQRSTYC
jgi:hypothetical protein